MKAPSSDSSEDDGAEEIELDYEDFFSVLMYYGHMSKQDIMNSSRPFLYGIYRNYVKRACENLGVSADGETDENGDEYPKDFGKLTPDEKKKRDEYLGQFKDSNDFMSQFGGMIPQKMFKKQEESKDKEIIL